MEIPNIRWHTHNGTDMPKIKPTDLAAWVFLPKTPSQTAPINNGQWMAFEPGDISIYITGYGWSTVSFINSYVQMTNANQSISALGTAQIFTGVTIQDNQIQMGQNLVPPVNAGTFTAKTFGWYQVNLVVKTNQDATLDIRKNGVLYAEASGNGTIALSRMIQLSAGDTLTFFLTNDDSLSSMTLSGTILNTELDIYKLANVNS